MYFGKHLTRIHCHIVTLSSSLVSLSLCFHSSALDLSLTHAHTQRKSNLTQSLKTAIISYQGFYDSGQIEYVFCDWFRLKRKACT